jgi:hypothetical protein
LTAATIYTCDGCACGRPELQDESLHLVLARSPIENGWEESQQAWRLTDFPQGVSLLSTKKSSTNNMVYDKSTVWRNGMCDM